jgi:hypothetical protein
MLKPTITLQLAVFDDVNCDIIVTAFARAKRADYVYDFKISRFYSKYMWVLYP